MTQGADNDILKIKQAVEESLNAMPRISENRMSLAKKILLLQIDRMLLNALPECDEKKSYPPKNDISVKASFRHASPRDPITGRIRFSLLPEPTPTEPEKIPARFSLDEENAFYLADALLGHLNLSQSPTSWGIPSVSVSVPSDSTGPCPNARSSTACCGVENGPSKRSPSNKICHEPD